MDRELQFSYSVFDAIENDVAPQKDKSRKKEVIDIRSIVADIKQQLEDQMKVFNRNLMEMIREEVRIPVSKPVYYTAPPTKPDDSPRLEIESGGSTLNGQESHGKMPDLSHKNIMVTTSIRNKGESVLYHVSEFSRESMVVNTSMVHGGEEKGKIGEGEKESPIEPRIKLINEERTPDSTFYNGDSNTTNVFSVNNPESGMLGFCLDLEPDPPDLCFPLFSIGLSKDSTIVSNSTENGGILTDSSTPDSFWISVEGSKRREVKKAQVKDYFMAQAQSVILNRPKPKPVILYCLNPTPNLFRIFNLPTYSVLADERDGWSDDQRRLPPPPLRPPLSSLAPPSPPSSPIEGVVGFKASINIKVYLDQFVLRREEKETASTRYEDLRPRHLDENSQSRLTNLDGLQPLRDLTDAESFSKYIKSFYTLYKARASIKNTLAGDLYKIFCGSPDETIKEMQKACFICLSFVEGCATGPVALLSRLNLDSLSLVLHFLAIVIYGVGYRFRFGAAHPHTADLVHSQFCNYFYQYRIIGNRLCLVQGDQYTVVIMETDKNFDNVLDLGYFCVPWILGSQLVGHLKLRFQQLAMKFETETKDKVFVNVVVSIQYWDLTDKASETLFKLSNTRSQLQVYDFDVIRACIPKLNLDDAYGFKVVRMLIVDTKPDESVQRAMSEINVATRLRMVATERQETGKILQIKSAEGEAESKYLSGLHNTLQCQAIVDGWGHRVLGFAIKVPGTIVKEVVDVVLVTMYFETMKESWHTFKSSVVLVAKGPWVLMLTKTTWNETLAWSWTDGRMVGHSMNSSDRIWSLIEAEREPNWEDWTSLTTGLREIVTGQQQFLYFYYPP